MTKIIEFYAPPGSGKSSLAAACYTTLGYKGESCTLLPEWLKNHANRGQYKPTPLDQPFIFGNQSQLEVNAIMAGYRIAFCESSSLLCGWYSHHYSRGRSPRLTEAILEWEAAVAAQYEIERKRVFIDLPEVVYRERYKEEGRWEEFSQAMEMKDLMKEWLLKIDPNTLIIHETNPTHLLSLLGE